MNIEVLVVTTNQNDFELVNKMNIQTDAIVGNQSNVNKVEATIIGNNRVRYFTFDEKGVGLNRNNILFRTSAEVCIFADDDMIFVEGYSKIVEDTFLEVPDADVLIFNLIDKSNMIPVTKKIKKINWFNYMKYGAARITIRTKSIKIHGISFNLCFGGGTEHSNGEDTLFLHDCLKAGLNIYAIPVDIAILKDERESTWFKGYNDNFFVDKGLLFSLLSKNFPNLLCLQDAIRHRKLYQINWRVTYSLMKQGIRNYKKKIY